MLSCSNVKHVNYASPLKKDEPSLSVVSVLQKPDRNEEIRNNQHQTLQPVASAVGADEGGSDHRGEHGRRLKRVKVQVQRHSDHPSNDDTHGNDKERDLDGRTDGHAHGDVHLVPPGKHDRGAVFRSIAHNRHNDGAAEQRWDAVPAAPPKRLE